MRRLPPPVRARACRSACTRACTCARVRACVCPVTRGTRASAHAQTIFFSRASCNHLMPYLGPRTATRPFAVSFSFPLRPPPVVPLFFSPSLLLPTTFSSVYFPPFLLELFFPSSPTYLRASHSPSRVCSLDFFLALQFLFPPLVQLEVG